MMKAIKAPKLAKQLQPVIRLRDDGEGISGVIMEHCTVAEQETWHRQRWDEVRLAYVEGSEGLIRNTDWIDVCMDHCSFPQGAQQQIALRRVAATDCKLLGWTWENCLLQDVVFIRCNVSYQSFVDCTLKRVAFIDCKMTDSIWFQSRLEQVTVSHCDLRRAEWTQTAWSGIDVSDCELDGLRSDGESLRQTIISAEQAVMVCRMMGYVVKE